MNKEKTGELIRNARKNKNYTQTELGDILGVTNKAVSRWEKGESFPDIGVLENLATVLDLKIQDIVVGEIQKEEIDRSSETTIVDILRLSKIQMHTKRKRVLCLMLSSLALFSGIIAGAIGLQNLGAFYDGVPIVYLYILFIVSIFLLIYGWYDQKYIECQANGLEKIFCFVSIITYMWEAVISFVVSIFVINDIPVFGLEIYKTGPFIVVNLYVVFIVNSLILLFELILWWKGKGRLHYGFVFQISAIYLAAIYGETLHNCSSVNRFFFLLSIRTAIVMVLGLTSLIYMRFATRYAQKHNEIKKEDYNEK